MRRFWGCTAGMLLVAATLAAGGPVGKHGALFAGGYVAGFIVLLGMVRYFPTQWTTRRTFCFAFCLGAALRCLFLSFPPSYDVSRYVWEGWIQLQGINPYTYAPGDPILAPLAQGPLKSIWAQINHKDFSAAYPPLALLVFRFLAGIRPDPMVYKIVMAGFDLAVLMPLGLIFREYRIPMKRLLWYAANPLLLVFIAGEGHLDSLMVLPLCLGLAMVLTRKARTGFFCIGCAAMAKYFAFLALPFLLNRCNWKAAAWALVPVLCFLPFLDAGRGVLDSLFAFGRDMHYNDLLTTLLRLLLGAGTPLSAMVILAVGLGLVFLTVPDRLYSLHLAFGWLLICLPTLHPWYLALIAPFAAAFASPAWLCLQAAVAATFPVLIREYHTGVFQEIHWLKFFEFMPFCILLGWTRRRRHLPGFRAYRPVRTLSAVIPALNEAARIGPCVRALLRQPELAEVIVADGGSGDATRAWARAAGARVVSCPRPGRGSQIRDGIRQARGDAVVIVHADCRLNTGACARFMAALEADPLLAGGAFGMSFDSPGIHKKMIAFLNNFRARATGISFGDQGQFFRTEALERMDGFPGQMLMEDVELSLRLKPIGRVAFLGNGITVSGRRWDAQPFSQGVFRVLYLFTRYLLARRWGPRDSRAETYYNRYYPPKTIGKTPEIWNK